MTLYTRKTWFPGSAGGTLIRAADLNDLEAGVQQAAIEVTDALSQLAAWGLGDLADVDTTVTPTDGSPLVWDAGTSKWRSGAAAFAALSDVDLTGAADGDTMVYDAGTGHIVPGSAGAGSFETLSDVDWSTPPTIGQIFEWDGSKLVPTDRPTIPPQTFMWTKEGVLATSTGVLKIYNDTGLTLNLDLVRISLGTGPSSGTFIVDVKKNGTSIFTSGNRPQTTGTADTSVPDAATTWAPGAFLTYDIAALGSGAPANLVVTVVAS